ncbi:MAG TPA: c-type cytochrome [Polyangiaceae bacterium]|nr:c-type cytochrome [Polyangiaceae bacterium]
MRWSALVLAAVGCVACLGLALGAQRALSPLRPSPASGYHEARRVAQAEAPDQVSVARERLEQFEAARRRVSDFARLPPANRSHGADPYALARLDAQHLVGVLRGASALVLLDAELHELQRIDVPGSALALTVTEAGQCWVAGEASATLLRFDFDGHRLLRSGQLVVPEVVGFRALASGPGGVLFALDVHDGKLLTLEPWHARPVREVRALGHGPLSVRRLGSLLIVDLLLDHSLLVYRLSAQGRIVEQRARVRHDGPIWGFDAALLSDGQLLLAAAGVEDHALDRGDGSFGYIDSFVFGYLLPKSGELRALWRKNVSELGVVTPKAPLLSVTGSEARLFVSGYGSDRALQLYFEATSQAEPRAQSEPFFPGTASALRLPTGEIAFADPLLDAWLLRKAAGERAHPAELVPVTSAQAPLASSEERLGEALFFTTLMAPSNGSEGAHSRFSCETCHFEGYVDGRVHSAGRDDVRVVTKPLRGLFNNRPHFSRALDADLATVSHHEFRVAGKGNGTDAWFSIRREDYPWLAQLGMAEDELGPEALRRALMAFLMGFSHTPNPRAAGRDRFSAEEQAGALLFREHCTSCHAARLESDVPQSALAFEAWASAIFSPQGAIVWASADYQKTGVTPYVHESGTRVPSLRRAAAKWPHFTNGSADTLLEVVSRARFDRNRFFHDGAPPDEGLRSFARDEARELTAFLELL